MQEFCVNNSLIARESERTFFDKRKFRILRFNHSGFAILRKNSSDNFTREGFSKTCREEGISDSDANAFWEKCIANAVIVSA